VDYGIHGVGYARQRRPDPRIGAYIHAALGDARTVLNVGAGAGSYEPEDRHVIAIEPSAAMRAQRPRHLAPAIDAVAEDLPLDDDAVDAAMASVTVHQWPDAERGLRELRRVTRGPIAVLTFEAEAVRRYWLMDFVPEVLTAEAARYLELERIAEILGGSTEIIPIPIPFDCTDGFVEAFYGRPETLLDPNVRRAQSAWSLITPEAHEQGVERLRSALESGEWDRRLGKLRSEPFYEGSLRLIISRPSGVDAES
jgi:SAM-dependent methyltransferase